MVSAPVIRDRPDGFCEERIELQAILSSPLFLRAPKLSKILAYICEKYFSGKAGDLKEYSIAVDALGRAPGFDPQADAIVRVDLHLLRKRLELYYAHDGKHRRIRIVLPLGQYAPEFVPNDGRRAADGRIPVKSALSTASLIEQCDLPQPSIAFTGNSGIRVPTLTAPSILNRVKRWAHRKTLLTTIFSGLIGITIGAGGVLGLYGRRLNMLSMFAGASTPAKLANSETLRHLLAGSDSEDRAIRIRCGSDQDYVDTGGFRWSADRFYSGGAIFRRDAIAILRSEDSVLYSTGRQGVFHYDIPVAPGTYEVRLLFTESAPGIEDNLPQISFISGAGNSDPVDVAADVDGTKTATMKVYTHVHPGTDRKIHIHFQSAGGFLNALEIFPETDAKPTPFNVILR